MPEIKIKRVYDAPAPHDGYRILVDRLWPRGLSKEKAALDEWIKEIAPSTLLRKWFNHDPEKWEEFGKRYEEELKSNSTLVKYLKQLTHKKRVTLLYGAKDTAHNEAIILKHFLEK